MNSLTYFRTRILMPISNAEYTLFWFMHGFDLRKTGTDARYRKLLLNQKQESMP